MSKEYNLEVDKRDSANIMLNREEGFKDRKQAIWVVMLSILVGLWVMMTMAGYDRMTGLNWTIFAVLTAVAVAVTMAMNDNLKKGPAIFWLTVIAVIASTFFRMSNFPILTFLFLPTLVVFFTIYAAKSPSSNVIAKFFYRHFAFFIHFWRIFKLRIGADGEGKKSTLVKVLLGVGLSVVLLLIIIPLMLSADAAFKSSFEKIFDFQDFFDLFVSRLIGGILIALLAFAFLFTITVKKNVPIENAANHKKREDMSAMVITVLFVIGAVFVTFSLIQAWHLFIRAGGALPDGYTFTEYAVEGYWNQAWLTAVNLMVVLGALALNRRAPDARRKVVNRLLTLMTTINVYLVFSAAYKMHLYEGQYGFTEKRALVYLILLFELVTLILLIISIFNRKFPFIKTVVYLGAAYFAVVACLNLQAFSVKQNIERYHETGEIDIYYLVHHAPDASVLKKDFYIENYDSLTEEEREDFEYDFDLIYYTTVRDIEVNNIRYRTSSEYEKRYHENYYGDSHWFEFNISRCRKYKAGLEMLKFLQARGQ